MKKLILLFAFAVVGFASAKKIGVWTSTCGIKHYTTFSDSATNEQIIATVQQINQNECGETPNVNVNP